MRLLLLLLIMSCSSSVPVMRGTVYTQFVGTFKYDHGLRKVQWHEIVRGQFCKQLLIKKKKEEVGDSFELVMARSTYVEVGSLGNKCMYNYIEWRLRNTKNSEIALKLKEDSKKQKVEQETTEELLN